MKVEVKNKAPSFLEGLFFDFDIRTQPFDLREVVDTCKEYFDKAVINYFSKERTEYLGHEGLGSYDITTSYISIKFFRENKHVKTLRIKESAPIDRTNSYVSLLKSNLEKIDLAKRWFKAA